MNSASAKQLGLSTARKWFLRTEVPSLAQAIYTLAPECAEESLSWIDVVDFGSMVVSDNGVLHVDTTIKMSPDPEHIGISFII